MKDYGIIWGQKEINVIPSYKKVVAAIDKSISDLQRDEHVYVKWREDYELGFAHYYDVKQLEETKGFSK